jgi:uncharacterized protein (TIGR02118 family)
MVRVIVLLPGRADRGQEEFRRYLDEKHLPLVKRLPGLQRLVVDYAMPASSGTASASDAVAGDWFESPQAMQALPPRRKGRRSAPIPRTSPTLTG